MFELRKALARTSVALVSLAVLVFGAAFVMILWSDPQFTKPLEPSPEEIEAFMSSLEQPYASAERSFRMRDGTMLASQYLAADSADTIVVVHGVLGASLRLNRSSGLLREAGGAEVVAVDMRGHGASGGLPGDTDYIGQYEDDLGEVIREVRAARPSGKVILAGHSMGGGIALRYAMKPGLPEVDGYLLLAPHLGAKSPTTRTEPAAAAAEMVKVHIPRILGLVVMNCARVTAFNGLRTLFFNLPPELPLRSYSFRAMASMTPADHRPALAAVRVPLLLVAGSRDEAFKADQYEAALRGSSDGTVVLVPEATHDSVMTDPRTMAAVRAWVEEL